MTTSPATSASELMAKMLRKQLWGIITKAVGPPDELAKLLDAHLQHQIRLEKAGIMFERGRCRTPTAPRPARA